jgi:outer membrane lipoprotein carrier protein
MPSTLLRALLAAAVVSFAANVAGAANADCAAEVATRVQRRYENVRDLSAQFRQTTQRAALGGENADALVARGSVVFAKPGRMRWKYETPEPSEVVSDGKTLWIYDPQAREVQKLAVAEGYLSAAGVQFLLGDGKLLDEFRVTATDCGAAIVTLALAPRREAQYERLELRVDRASGAVRESVVVDLFGNRTAIAFEELRENTKPDASTFEFAAPDGVRVISVPGAP